MVQTRWLGTFSPANSMVPIEDALYLAAPSGDSFLLRFDESRQVSDLSDMQTDLLSRNGRG